LIAQYGDMTVTAVVGFMSTVISFGFAAYFGQKIRHLEKDPVTGKLVNKKKEAQKAAQKK